MPTVESIKHEHILKALEQLRKKRDIPPHRGSTKYDLIYKGERYPPKYVVTLSKTFAAPGIKWKTFLRAGKQTNDFLESRGFTPVPRSAAPPEPPNSNRRFWVVSPNVRGHNATVTEWKQASEKHHAAFMGWGPKDHNHRLGPKFANDIKPDDFILIARQFNWKPDVVGFGIVTGTYQDDQKDLKGFTEPTRPPGKSEWKGSYRKLSPFIRVTAPSVGFPVVRALNHTQALRELHPDRNADHRRICEWMSKKLGMASGTKGKQSAASQPKAPKPTVRSKPHRDPAQFDFLRRSAKAVMVARKREDALVRDYKKWLDGKGRVVEKVLFGRFVCDAHEKARNNLIEAKSFNKREYIRMAVGQLLDYAFLGKKTLVTPNMAILLPKEPEKEILTWLDGLNISVIWKQGKAFKDNAGEQFT